jgi:hypothetical protein
VVAVRLRELIAVVSKTLTTAPGQVLLESVRESGRSSAGGVYLERGHPPQQLFHRRGAVERLLVAMAVDEQPPEVRPQLPVADAQLGSQTTTGRPSRR